MYFDLAVVGGGPAGSSLSNHLAEKGWQVVQIDGRKEADFKPGEGLVPAAKRMLKELGAWAEFKEQGHLESYGNESVWGHPNPVSSDYLRSIDGNGWRLDRVKFDNLLRETAKASGVEQVQCFVERIHGEAGNWNLELRTGKRIQCKWLVDATGRSARLARQMGAVRTDFDELVAFYAHYRPREYGEDLYASGLIESAPGGWWYNALLPDGHRVLYAFTDVGSAFQKQLQTVEGFEKALAETRFVRERLDQFGYRMLTEPKAADARSARLDRVFGDGWLAAGDSAMSFDPLSSQGIFTAMYGGIQGGMALSSHENGEKEALNQYAETMEDVWQAYLTNKNKYYAQERRWPGEEFWSKRCKELV